MITDTRFHPDEFPVIICKDPDDPKWKKYKDAGYDVHGELQTARTAEGLDKEGLAISHRRFEGMRSGPALILGMGPSRHRLQARLNIPVYAVNRAATVYPHATVWCAHDLDGVLDAADHVKEDTPLATYACNWLKEGFDKITGSGRPLIAWDIFGDPRRHSRRPLYWNVTTLGLVLDWVVRMGHNPIYTLGTDLTQETYGNPHYKPREHEYTLELVRLKMCFMFTPKELPKWNPSGVPIYDLSGGNAPWEHRDISELEPYVVSAAPPSEVSC